MWPPPRRGGQDANEPTVPAVVQESVVQENVITVALVSLVVIPEGDLLLSFVSAVAVAFIPTPCATITAAALYQPERAAAATAKGYKSSLLAVGRFGEINVSNSFPHHAKEERNEQLWFSLQQTKGPSDLYIQNNVWQPGESTGWHTHPGHSLIIVAEGTVTEYMSDDPECKPHVYTQGMGLVDPGGNHVHLIKNEGTVPAITIAVQLIPSGTDRRIDAAQPTNCHR
jgi:quercetin dioxygenase-like cupin family protein